jgi:hypothetical protein
VWDFDGDEFVFFAFAGIAAFILATRFFRQIGGVSNLICPAPMQFSLAAVPILCFLIVFITLQNWSDPQTVRGHPDYVSLFMAGGALWIFGSPALARFMGIGLRDDVIERHNPAAALVIAATMIAYTLCYAGSNIGSGPTIWTTIVPAVVAGGALMEIWLLVELTTHVSEAVTIDRDLRCAALLAGLFIVCGIDLGWAMAGDWNSWGGTFSDFAHRAWPTALFALAAIVAIQIWKPRCMPPPTRY